MTKSVFYPLKVIYDINILILSLVMVLFFPFVLTSIKRVKGVQSTSKYILSLNSPYPQRIKIKIILIMSSKKVCGSILYV